jgi:hypothetical protein
MRTTILSRFINLFLVWIFELVCKEEQKRNDGKNPLDEIC